MKIEQLYTNCLAEAAYYIESEGEVAIIDPLRETAPYIEKAKADNATIKYVFETHFHADFVSGHIDLANETGATIVFGPTAKTSYNMHEAADGEEFQLGKLRIKALHTPGHTPESTTYLLIDENGKDHAIFTGDTLFIGDVGRPDLAVKGDLTQEDLAGMLYDSLRSKIMPLSNDVIVYPAHGAGSACGKNMSSETWSTLGNQKETNYALRDMSREQFIAEVTEGIAPPPQYFPKNALLNKHGYESIDTVMTRGVQPLSVDAFAAASESGALIIDTRPKEAFVKGYVPGSVFIGLDGSYATWIGTLIEDIKAPIYIVAEQGKAEEAVMRLARVGYDNASGYLDGGFEAWKSAGKPVETIDNITVDQLNEKINAGPAKVVDVRKPTEFEAEHVADAIAYPLNYINEHLHELDKDETSYVHCKSGYRSVIAISMLRREGYNNLVNVLGGMDAILKSPIKTSEFVCASKA